MSLDPLAPNPHFATTSLHAGSLRWQVRLPLLPSEFQGVLQDPDAYLSDPTKRIAHSDLITMSVLTDPRATQPQLLLRRLNYGRWRHRLRDVFRPTRAERAFTHGLAMERAGVPTPRVLAAGVERCCWRWPVRAYLLTEFVPRAVTLWQLLTAHDRLTSEHTRQLAGIMAKLHQAGFTHRDLKSPNILFNTLGQACFIDLDGVRRHQVVSRQQAANNLAKLARDFLACGQSTGMPWFLKHYCTQRGLRSELRALHLAVQKELTAIPQK